MNPTTSNSRSLFDVVSWKDETLFIKKLAKIIFPPKNRRGIKSPNT